MQGYIHLVFVSLGIILLPRLLIYAFEYLLKKIDVSWGECCLWSVLSFILCCMR